jgi:hypothetical protein
MVVGPYCRADAEAPEEIEEDNIKEEEEEEPATHAAAMIKVSPG